MQRHNPLMYDMNNNQSSLNFKKKKPVKIFEEQNPRTSLPSNPHNISQNQSRSSIGNTSFLSLNTQNVTDLVNSPYFYQQIANNQELLNLLSSNLQNVVLSQNKQFTSQLIDSKLKQEVKTEMNNFKVEFSDILAHMINKSAQDESKQEIKELKLKIAELESKQKTTLRQHP